MKNILDRLESVIASTDATLSHKLSEARSGKESFNAFEKFIASGGDDAATKSFVKFYKKNKNFCELSYGGDGEQEEYPYTVTVPLRYGLEISISLGVNQDGEGSLTAIELQGDGGNDYIADLEFEDVLSSIASS
jgi:hypothetical protein